MQLHLLALSSLLAAASARLPYEFSDGYQNIIGEPDQSFSCAGRQYGYYADVANDCRVFHVCHPLVDDLGEVTSMEHYSFFCGNQTIFNQESLTCDHPEDAFPCNEAASLYDLVNSEFGRRLDDESFDDY